MSCKDVAENNDKTVAENKTLWAAWETIIGDWENNKEKQNNHIRELVRRGIPLQFRGIVWKLLCSAMETPEKKLYQEYLKINSPFEKTIKTDLTRIYPRHEFFKMKEGPEQKSLFNVLKAYSLYDREFGYCQGSCYIAGLLLMQMPEEDAFAVLIKIMQNYHIRDVLKPTTTRLDLCLYQLNYLVSEQLPELNQHFVSQNFETSMYAANWFLSLFSSTLSYPLVCRIIDIFLLEGMEILFKISVALLHMEKTTLMSMDTEQMLMFFHKELPNLAEINADILMKYAYNIKYNSKKMKELEREYFNHKNKEDEEITLLRRLQAENKQIKHKCEMLDNECKTLADRLISGQVNYYKEKETNFVVQSELEALHQIYMESTYNLAKDKEHKLFEMQEMIVCLQQELVKVRLKEAENDVIIRNLRADIQELEADKKMLRETVPDGKIAHLQEELITVKLREAEADLSLKDLHRQISELNMKWQKHLQECGKRNGNSSNYDQVSRKRLFSWGNRNNEIQNLEEELITNKIKEMQVLVEVKELRLKLMELESQVQIRTNHLQRKDNEIEKLLENMEILEKKHVETLARLTEERRRYSDLESCMKDELLRSGIRHAESVRMVSELTQRISHLEITNEEIATESELNTAAVDYSERVKELQEKIVDLQAEILNLKTFSGRVRLLSERSLSVDDVDETLRLKLESLLGTPTPNSPNDNKCSFSDDETEP